MCIKIKNKKENCLKKEQNKTEMNMIRAKPS